MTVQCRSPPVQQFCRRHSQAANDLRPVGGPNLKAIPGISMRGPMKALQFVAAAALLAAVNVTAAAEFGTKDEAMALVKKAVVFIKAQGADKAYPEISNKSGPFIDRDLYVVVYGLDGKVLAHGANGKLIGKDLLDAQDVDGKFFVKERVELARQQPTFWQDYKFANPVSKKVEPKQMYCERVGETAVCSGIYKL
jgi:cytochrome c